MGWAGLNKREFPRVNLSCDISIDHEGAPIKAKSENLGPGGLCVILKKELTKFSVVQLKLQFESEKTPIICSGRVVWIVKSKRIGSPEITYDTGIEFVNLSAIDDIRIKDYITSIQS